MANIVRQEIRITPLSELRPHPKNPRKGDVEAISESIEVIGFYGTVVAQVSTGHVLAGNHRYYAAEATGLDSLPVAWVDCDDATALRILAADNRTSDLGEYDDRLLADLLSTISNENEAGLQGTGYGETDLESLVGSLLPKAPSSPATSLQGLSLTSPLLCTCPKCGHRFDPNEPVE